MNTVKAADCRSLVREFRLYVGVQEMVRCVSGSVAVIWMVSEGFSLINIIAVRRRKDDLRQD